MYYYMLTIVEFYNTYCSKYEMKITFHLPSITDVNWRAQPVVADPY